VTRPAGRTGLWHVGNVSDGTLGEGAAKMDFGGKSLVKGHKYGALRPWLSPARGRLSIFQLSLSPQPGQAPVTKTKAARHRCSPPPFSFHYSFTSSTTVHHGTSFMTDRHGIAGHCGVVLNWFMFINHNFTCILGDADRVDVPSDDSVYRYLGLGLLQDASGDPKVWKSRTPRRSREVKQEVYLAELTGNSLARLKIPEEGEEAEAEAETKKGKPKPKPKGKGKAKPKLKEDGDVALEPDDKMSLHLKELSPLEARTSVLVQVPATAGCASCRVISTGCISNSQRWQCRRWMVNA